MAKKSAMGIVLDKAKELADGALIANFMQILGTEQFNQWMETIVKTYFSEDVSINVKKCYFDHKTKTLCFDVDMDGTDVKLSLKRDNDVMKYSIKFTKEDAEGGNTTTIELSYFGCSNGYKYNNPNDEEEKGEEA